MLRLASAAAVACAGAATFQLSWKDSDGVVAQCFEASSTHQHSHHPPSEAEVAAFASWLRRQGADIDGVELRPSDKVGGGGRLGGGRGGV